MGQITPTIGRVFHGSFWDINLQFVNVPKALWPNAYDWPLTEAYFDTWMLRLDERIRHRHLGAECLRLGLIWQRGNSGGHEKWRRIDFLEKLRRGKLLYGQLAV